MTEAFEVYAYVVGAGVFGILFAAYLFWEVSKIKVTRRGDGYALLSSDVRHQTADRLFEIYCAIQEGARAFLLAEYTCALPLSLSLAPWCSCSRRSSTRTASVLTGSLVS